MHMRQRRNHNEIIFGHWTEMGDLWGDVLIAQKQDIETESNISPR